MNLEQAMKFADEYHEMVELGIDHASRVPLAIRSALTAFAVLNEHIRNEQRREWRKTYNAALTGLLAHDADISVGATHQAAVAAANFAHGLKP